MSRAKSICRGAVVAVATCSLAAAGWCYLLYRQDRVRLRTVAVQVTSRSDTQAQKVLSLLHWVHERGARTNNSSYFVLRRMRATPLQVLDGGGDCADKSRLLTALLREVGIPATMAMCFDARTGRPAHTFVEARIGGDTCMAVDPAYDLYFPRPGSTGYYDLLDLRRDSGILTRRIDQLCTESSQACEVFRYYAGPSAEYNNASSINWNKNAFARLLHDCLRWPLGDAVYRLQRPTVLEEPRLFVAVLGTIPSVAAVCVLVCIARTRRAGRKSTIRPPEPRRGECMVSWG